MNKKMDNCLLKCFIDTLIFLEFSDASIIDEDISIGLLEQFSYNLSFMNDNDKKELAKNIELLALEYPVEKEDFILSLPESLGLKE